MILVTEVHKSSDESLIEILSLGLACLFIVCLFVFAAFSEEEVNMWITGLNWLMIDTQRAPAPQQIDR